MIVLYMCSSLYMKAFMLEASVFSESLFTGTSGYDECFIFNNLKLKENLPYLGFKTKPHPTED